MISGTSTKNDNQTAGAATSDQGGKHETGIIILVCFCSMYMYAFIGAETAISKWIDVNSISGSINLFSNYSSSTFCDNSKVIMIYCQ